MARRLTETERKTYNSYHIPNSSHLFKRKINAVHISAANSEPHELEKCKIAHRLIKQGHKIVTEAQENSSRLIRDLVDLTTGDIYEVETTKQRAKRFEGDTRVIVVKLWE